jgi:hypothetical protein
VVEEVGRDETLACDEMLCVYVDDVVCSVGRYDHRSGDVVFLRIKFGGALGGAHFTFDETPNPRFPPDDSRLGRVLSIDGRPVARVGRPPNTSKVVSLAEWRAARERGAR